MDSKGYKSVSGWLFVTAMAVFGLAIVGAITRLTESGLSITQWDPVVGIIPPLSPADWQHEFDLYRQSPQYQQLNAGMSMADFKFIFFWEWFHRFLARAIGFIYAVPLVYFWLRKKLPMDYKWSFIGLLALGGLQGLIGWYMVQSGLVDRPSVSHYRLALHLMTAFLIFSLLIRLGLKISLSANAQAAVLSPLRPLAVMSMVWAVLTMIWGAFVAGLDAGLIYNSFPMMGRYPWPTEGLDMTPVWINLFENHAMVQFTHRVLAVLTFIHVAMLWWRSRGFHVPPRVRFLFTALGFMITLQLVLGITTLLSGVNIVIATLHQGGALVVLGLLVWALIEIPHRRYSEG